MATGIQQAEEMQANEWLPAKARQHLGKNGQMYEG